jgi:monomeric isocitrate dehydrogenase
MMAYRYEDEKPKLFTESGQEMFLKIRDNADRLLEQAGAAMSGRITSNVTGDSWQMQACIDRLVELGEIVEAMNPVSQWGQHRVFVRPHQ